MNYVPYKTLTSCVILYNMIKPGLSLSSNEYRFYQKKLGWQAYLDRRRILEEEHRHDGRKEGARKWPDEIPVPRRSERCA